MLVEEHFLGIASTSETGGEDSRKFGVLSFVTFLVFVFFTVGKE